MKHPFRTKPNKQFEYDSPRVYEVEFETGHVEEVMAVSARDAKSKTMHLQAVYGFYKSGSEKKDE